MSKFGGIFSQGLASLALQLEHLFTGVGGKEAIKFLDSLSTLSEAEQAIVLRAFNSLITRLKECQGPLETEGELALSRFEDSLYSQIITAMREAALPKDGGALKVLDGGKQYRTVPGIRKSRKNHLKALVN